MKMYTFSFISLQLVLVLVRERKKVEVNFLWKLSGCIKEMIFVIFGKINSLAEKEMNIGYYYMLDITIPIQDNN